VKLAINTDAGRIKAIYQERNENATTDRTTQGLPWFANKLQIYTGYHAFVSPGAETTKSVKTHILTLAVHQLTASSYDILGL